MLPLSGILTERFARRRAEMPRDTWKSFWNAHPAIKPMTVVFLIVGFWMGIAFDACIVSPQANKSCAALMHERGE